MSYMYIHSYRYHMTVAVYIYTCTYTWHVVRTVQRVHVLVLAGLLEVVIYNTVNPRNAPKPRLGVYKGLKYLRLRV